MSGINRWLSRKDRREVVAGTTNTQHVVFTDSLFDLVTVQEKEHKADREEEKKTKVLSKRIRKEGNAFLDEARVLEFAMRSKYAEGDVDRAYELLRLYDEASQGILKGFDPKVQLQGSENREKVTCYISALLFAMFARLDNFEILLMKKFDDEPRQNLVVLLRLWVNMLRTGKLITTDIMKHLQEALAACGWEDAALLHQQDASEAFTFITEKLALPLLTLKMDIYHVGKEDLNDDHKFVNERMLEVAIPEPPQDGSAVKLEDCLEAYFNNSIEVKRYLERKGTLGGSAWEDAAKEKLAHTGVTDLGSNPSSPVIDQESPLQNTLQRSLTAPMTRPARSKSIIREVVEPGHPSHERRPSLSGYVRRKNSVRKEVLMPAWQFYQLIPWYTDNTPSNDAQVAAHFASKRPMLGICLKRYFVQPDGRPGRLGTHVDIPLEIGLPHFIHDEGMESGAPLFGNFKLSLQAVVCHRGKSLDSGHYISFTRYGDLVRDTNECADSSYPQASSSNEGGGEGEGEGAGDHWMMLDDLAKERVCRVDISQALNEESPYLLFYQVQPIEEEDLPIFPSGDAPPAYTPRNESDGYVTRAESLSDGASPSFNVSRNTSLELPRQNLEPSRPSMSSERRPRSVFWVDDSGDESGPGGGSSASGPPSLPPKDLPTSHPDSARPSARQPSSTTTTTTKPSSRSTSHLGEGRLSATFSRFSSKIPSRSDQRPPSSSDTSVPARTPVPGPPPIPGPTTTAAPVSDLLSLSSGLDSSTRAKRKKEKKDKGKQRSSNLLNSDDLMWKSGKVPDRQCNVM